MLTVAGREDPSFTHTRSEIQWDLRGGARHLKRGGAGRAPPACASGNEGRTVEGTRRPRRRRRVSLALSFLEVNGVLH